MQRRAMIVARATLVVADVVAVAALRPAPGLWSRLRHLRGLVAREGADRATTEVAGAVLWLVALWCAVCLGAGLAAARPGRVGRLGARLSGLVTPRALRALVAGTLGTAVVLVPSVGSVASGRPASTAPRVAAPAWPTDSPRPAPAWPTTPDRAAPDRPTPDRGPADGATPPTVAPTAPHGSAWGAGRTHPPATRVVVRPGDSLWRIAADHLPPPAPAARVARSWPRWYAANRRVVGSDPDHLEPGQVLRRPVPREQP